jgi:epidermal growth factor receptor substrate 15
MRNSPGLLPKLNLTEEERRVYNLLFKQADTKNDGIVTGDVAIPLFARTKIPEHTLGEVSGIVRETRATRADNYQIWAMADTENRGFLLGEDFAKSMRLVGHWQSQPGRILSTELALQRTFALYHAGNVRLLTLCASSFSSRLPEV